MRRILLAIACILVGLASGALHAQKLDFSFGLGCYKPSDTLRLLKLENSPPSERAAEQTKLMASKACELALYARQDYLAAPVQGGVRAIEVWPVPEWIPPLEIVRLFVQGHRPPPAMMYFAPNLNFAWSP